MIHGTGGRRSGGGRALVAALVLQALATASGAHVVSPDEVVARLRAPAAREAYGIEEVSRLPGLPRLLLVRVGPRWREVPPDRRRAVAEDWARAWQHAVPQGVVSIVDAASGGAVVNFDGQGNAQVAP
jgi:hypothetical protein